MTMNAADTRNRTTQRLRRLAPWVGSFAAAYWLLAGIGSAIAERSPLTLESVIMAGLIVTSALSVLIAWWREGIGGILVVICGLAHSLFAWIVAGHHKLFAVSLSGGPLLVTGALFLATWRRSLELKPSDA